MSKKLSFQQIILKLLAYWEEQGCLVMQPHNVQVGAGTMNPTTILRVLGPEPWNVVYVEPSIRPDDGRFGDNPNRLQMHHQLQVILKPDPGDPQELYLKSLEAIGILPHEHDIRFVEDNWESPALGAWGLGWEVWLDGQEITQFTYFQQAGGQTLDPVSVEITYGLDRICLALQGVASVWEMEYGVNLSYENVLLQSEIEHCEYYFNVADVESLKQIYESYEREAARCVTAELAAPAHDYNLKCSHLFNVLDTRGAIGVTERANYFRRMRNMARKISELYLAQRERLEYPMLESKEPPISRQAEYVQTTSEKVPQMFLLEIGSEELPVGDLHSALQQLKTKVPELLNSLRLSYARVEVEGTPRRLAVMVHQLNGRQQDLETVAKGPPADRAFDADGNPTKAAIGFARGKKVDVADLKIVEDGKKRYVTAVIHQKGLPTAAVLAKALPELLASIRFGRSMRWNHTQVSYSRPLRWLVALYGPDIVPFIYAGVQSGRTSRGLRPNGSPDIEINDGRNYAGIMRNNQIVLPLNKRQELIKSVSAKLVAEKQGIIGDDAALLDEVANLVERPTPMRGMFDERFLALPAELLVAVMRKHQRYFPVYDDEGKLMPMFIAVRNGDEKHLDLVVEGNEQVLKARFADAEFFYSKDTKRPLADFLPRLATLTFQAKLGSMLDKVHRLEKLTPIVAGMVGLDDGETAVSLRAASLSKADLATNLVVEMTALQGIMGGQYARLSGESDEVAAAIAEQYTAVSQTKAGLALAQADRLDSLVGLFAAGLKPKGSNDPFALRRTAIYLLENLIENEIEFDLCAAIAKAAELMPIDVDATIQDAVAAFVNGRLVGILRERGHAVSVVNAVLAEQAYNPYAAAQTAVMLSEAVKAEDWPTLLDAYARCVRITRDKTEQFELNPDAFALDAERQLFSAYKTAVSQNNGSLDGLIVALRGMVPAITHFFDGVLVMDKETAVRHNRLALLQQIATLPKGIADLSQLEGF